MTTAIEVSNCKIDTFSWQDNASVQKLLDAIASIIAEEYIQVAKKNPEVFAESKSI